jgi:hypothetical protein
VSFGTTPPQFPIRGHFFWDGAHLFMWDGVEWQEVGPSSTSAGGVPEAPQDGKIYGRQNANWVVATTTLMPVFYNASQTIIIPQLATAALVQMWGATGGSCGVNNGNGGATGAGGYLEKYLSGLAPGNTIVFTQGAAGAAGSSAPGNGGNGGTTTLLSGTQTIPQLTCNGSLGSIAPATGASGAGTPGGTATGGDINFTGQAGTSGFTPGGTVFTYPGGVTFFSVGANGVGAVPATPGNPGNPGGLKMTWEIG